MSIAVVVLAGGEGQRIGGGKPLRHFGGERLIDRAVRLGRCWSDTVAVAVRDPHQVEPVEAQLITDATDIAGPLGGLAAGFQFAEKAGREFLLTIPADMPFLPDDLGQRLSQEIGGHRAAVATSAGQLHPVCALWRTDVLSDLIAYAAEGCRSLRGLAESVGAVRIDWLVDLSDPFFNINFADDLCEAERRLKDV